MPNYPTLHRWLFACTAIAGVLCIALSTRSTWFSVPVALHQTASESDAIGFIEPACTGVFQLLMWIGLAVLGLSAFRERAWSDGSNCVACTVLCICLAFPFATLMFSPVLSTDAVWLQMQYDNLIWLGGDINLSSESGHAFWGNKIYSNDIPRQIKVATLPTICTWDSGLYHASDFVAWLGYGEAFCQFFKRGWPLAVSGWALVAFSTLQVRGNVRLRRLGNSCVVVAGAGLILGAVAWGCFMSAARMVHQASLETRDRDYSAALARLESACCQLPILRQDTYYIAQRGLLESNLGRTSAYTILLHAIGKERRGQYDAAYDSFVSLIDAEDPAISREALRAIQRYAVQDFNTGRTELAAQRLEVVLARQPSNFKAIHLLQICYLRQNRLADVETMSRRMVMATNQLNFHSKKIFRATVERNSAIAALLANDAHRAWLHSIEAKNP